MALTDTLKADLEAFIAAVTDYENAVAAAIATAQAAGNAEAVAAIDALDAEVKAAGTTLAAAKAGLPV